MATSTEIARRAAEGGRELADLLAAQRWFAGKGAGDATVGVADWAPLGDAAVAALLDVRQGEGESGRYFVPLVATAEGALGDASRDEPAMRALLDLIARAAELPAQPGGSFAAERTEAFAAAAAAARGPFVPLKVEQSNTSLVFGRAIMLKLYRHVHAGPQPELEIARFLTRAGFANTPALLGSLEYRRGAERTACAIAQQFVATDGDAWETTLERLIVALRGGDAAAYGSLIARAKKIGERTAELHGAFARPLGDAAFDPEPVEPRDLAAWTERARESAAAAFAALQKRIDELEPLTRARARTLLERRGEIERRLDIAGEPGELGRKSRYHGDYHLGQLLSTGDDVMIVDFEGEPARPLAERRAKASALRDVAGMLRSFDYVASAAERALAAELPAGAADQRRALADRARTWREHAANAFLESYRNARADAAVSTALLDLFTVEKACYELSYELANRPPWVDIPLGGLERILDEAPAGRGAGR